jgi:hypothetical protein
VAGEKGDKRLISHTIAWTCVIRLIAIERWYSSNSKEVADACIQKV